MLPYYNRWQVKSGTNSPNLAMMILALREWLIKHELGRTVERWSLGAQNKEVQPQFFYLIFWSLDGSKNRGTTVVHTHHCFQRFLSS